MFKLRIRLESPLCSGSGLSRPGVADREVVFDDCGLPWLPGRRLKGLLRDAYTEVVDAVPVALSELPSRDRLFGVAGRECPGDLEIRSAFLPEYDALRAWAQAFVGSSSGTSRSATIMESFTAIRRQTAMDRLTGAPKQDTLRATRTLRSGLVFEAILGGSLTFPQLWAVALAAAALRNMGSSRWRGLGPVNCELIEYRASDEAFNWTRAALDGLSAERFQPVAPPSEASRTDPSGDDTIPASVLGYEISLEESAVFPVLAGDPNTVTTATCIPGSAIHGCFARRHGGFDSDEFRRLFTSGAVRFLNAHPEIDNERAQPLPHSVRRRKSSATLFVDLTNSTVEETRREGGWYHPDKLAESNLRRKEPDTSVHYHHARAENDLFQRAIGPEEARQILVPLEERGAFFQYVALSPGQKFHGEIHGSPEDLAIIRDLVASGTILGLGRSRSAQYGGRARLTWQISSPSSAPPSGPVTIFRLIARSAVLGYNSRGLATPRFPLEELERELDCSIDVQQEFARLTWEGGYLAHLRLPRPQQPAWAAGSVLVLQTRFGIQIDPVRFALAARRSYGLRREQGYGEVDLLAQPAPAGIQLLAAQQKVRVSAATANGAVRSLALHIFHSVARKEARLSAGDLVRRNMRGKLPTKALLHRLLAVLDAQTEEQFRVSLSDLRDRARNQIEGCRVLQDRGLIFEDTNLSEFLSFSRGVLAESLVHRLWSQEPWRRVFPERPSAPPNLGGLFMAEFLGALAKEAREGDT